MRIDIHLLGYLARFSPTKKEKFQLEFPNGATINQLLEEIELPADLSKVVLVNGCHGNGSAQLVDGDEVSIFIPEAGG